MTRSITEGMPQKCNFPRNDTFEPWSPYPLYHAIKETGIKGLC